MNPNPTFDPDCTYEQARAELLTILDPEKAAAVLGGEANELEADRLNDRYDDEKKAVLKEAMGLQSGSVFRWGRSPGRLWEVVDPAGFSRNVVIRSLSNGSDEMVFDDSQEIGLFRDWKRGEAFPVKLTYEEVR